jgi:hypothetical protein
MQQRIEDEKHDLVAMISSRDEEIEHLKTMQAWQPIETAPKDGDTEILIGKWFTDDADGYYGDSRWLWIIQATYDLDGSMWDCFADTEIPAQNMNGFNKPTHWMPLPAPPTGNEK